MVFSVGPNEVETRPPYIREKGVLCDVIRMAEGSSGGTTRGRGEKTEEKSRREGEGLPHRKRS